MLLFIAACIRLNTNVLDNLKNNHHVWEIQSQLKKKKVSNDMQIHQTPYNSFKKKQQLQVFLEPDDNLSWH